MNASSPNLPPSSFPQPGLPQPSLPQWGLIQAIRGPIMLITLGTLVEIDYVGIYGFSRTWPVLIIVFGLLKLLEKAAAPAVGYDTYNAPPPPGRNAI